jgi:hypothetical protein
VTGGQQAGGESAESEERGGCEQTACGKGALHPVGEDGANKAVKGKADDSAGGRADEHVARLEQAWLRTASGKGGRSVCSEMARLLVGIMVN